MSSKKSSLAVEEVKEKNKDQHSEIDFEPNLKVLVNKRFIKNSSQDATLRNVSIKGRITISF